MMERMGTPGGTFLVLVLGHMIAALEVPLDLPQPPTITLQSPKDYIIDPRENIVIHCEAKGKPHPRFSWTRNGTHFDIDKDPKVIMNPSSGTLNIDISEEKAEAYEGVYQCAARNEHGTAVSNNIFIRQSRSPLWSKERLEPIVVQEGVALVLQCRPPAGLPPPIIFWMDNIFQRLPQSSRVSQALNGDLYFSNVLPGDTRSDYICYARFPHTQTIQQKQPISLRVLDDSPSEPRRPTFMVPSGSSSTKMVLRGEILELECIAEGLPTPEISWRKESGELPNGRTSFQNFHKTLRISDVTEADAGGYRCTAKNDLGATYHIITAVVKAAPYWISPPSNLILAPKETGSITCQSNGIPKPTITWFMNGVPIENTPRDPSRKVEDDTVIFMDVQTGSSAVYQCNVSNEFGYLLGSAFVNVLAEPPRVLTPPNKVYQIISNRPAFLDCASFGSPIPKITWFKESQTSILDGDPYVLHKNGTLEIRVAQKFNSGKYTCVAMNSLGNKENHVELQVKEPTRIIKQPKYREVQRNGYVVFECKVKHDPTLNLTMTWLKDDGDLPDDDRFVIGEDSLTINDVTDRDEGTYTCVMNTTLDLDSAKAQLTVVEQPDPPTDLELTDPRDRSVQLTWTPGDEHNSPIQKFVIQYEDSLHDQGVWRNLTEVPGTKTTAHLKLSPYMQYSFRVRALNAVGISRPSYPSRQYKTDPAAPDENPSGVVGRGTEQNNLVIFWKPLTGLQSNGPGLQYKVSWRQIGDDWTMVTVANVSEYTVSPTPTFTPFEMKVQAINDYGSGPEPEVVVGYSGEDLPMAAPGNVQAIVQSSTVVEIHWDPILPDMVRGQLKEYKIYYWRETDLDKKETTQSEEHQVLTINRNVTRGRLSGLHPYSIYSFNVKACSGKGEGPPSEDQQFETPEGVPGPPAFLTVSNPSLDSLTLEWGPPLEQNGRLTSYSLKYQPINDTNELGPMEVLSLPANETIFTLFNLKHSTRYRFYFSALTSAGTGPNITQQGVTIMDESGEDWKKEPVNGSQNYQIKGLKAGTSYKVRVVAKDQSGQTVHRSEELLITLPAMASPQVDIATQGWFIGLMCAIALLILVLLIACFIKRNKGGKYPVKEKEDAHADPEIQPMKDDDGTFGEYSDMEDNKPLKGSRTSSNGTVKKDDSDDSLVDYGEGGDCQFNEDGSFIGQYSGKKEKDTAEGNESSEAPSPVNAMNSFV